MISDYYSILDLPRDADQEEIREAYFSAARQHHPDVNPDPRASERFLTFQRAYQILSNTESRRIYDLSLPPGMAVPDAQIQIATSRSALIRIKEAQLIYALLDLTPKTEPENRKLPSSHICLVLDRSTSMQGERMDMVKSSAIRLIRQLKPQDWVSVVIFNDRAEVLIPPTQVKELHKLDNRINLIKTGGGTELYHGLRCGYDLFNQVGGGKTINELILLTDGHTYGDELACLSISEAGNEEGVTITSIGIGDAWNDAFLDKLSAKTGGSAFFIQNDVDLSHIFKDKISALNLLFAKRVRMVGSFGSGVELRYAFRVQPESTPLAVEKPLQMGNLYYKNRLIVLLEFLVKDLPEREEEFRIFKGRIWMDLAERNGPASSLPIHIQLPIRSETDKKPVPVQIMEALSRLSLYRLQEKARGEVGEGKISDAMRHLRFLATHLLALGKRELAQSVLVEAEHIHQSHEYSPSGSKTIKYGTRDLFLPSGMEGLK